MRKLEEFSKDLSKKLDPRNIAKPVTSAFSTILKIFGVSIFAANFDKILAGLENIQTEARNFIAWIKGDKEKEPKLITNMKNMFRGLFFGESAKIDYQEGKGLFGNLGDLIKDTFKDLGQNISKGFKDMLDTIGGELKRRNGLAQQLFSGDPVKINPINPSPGIAKLLERLTDYLGIMLTGDKALYRIAEEQIGEAATEDKRNSYGVSTKTGKVTKYKTTNGNTIFVDSGDEDYITGTEKSMPDHYMNSQGELTSNSAGATIAMSRNISANIQAKEHGVQNQAKVTNGILNLYNAAKSRPDGMIMVNNEFLSSLSDKTRSRLIEYGELREGLPALKKDETGRLVYGNDLRTDLNGPEISSGEFFADVDPESYWYVAVPRSDEEILADFKNTNRNGDLGRILKRAYSNVSEDAIKAAQGQIRPRREVLGLGQSKEANTGLDAYRKVIDAVQTKKAYPYNLAQLNSYATGIGKNGAIFIASFCTVVWNYEMQALGLKRQVPTHVSMLLQAMDFTYETGEYSNVKTSTHQQNIGEQKTDRRKKVFVIPGFIVEKKADKAVSDNISFISAEAIKSVVVETAGMVGMTEEQIRKMDIDIHNPSFVTAVNMMTNPQTEDKKTTKTDINPGTMSSIGSGHLINPDNLGMNSADVNKTPGWFVSGGNNGSSAASSESNNNTGSTNSGGNTGESRDISETSKSEGTDDNSSNNGESEDGIIYGSHGAFDVNAASQWIMSNATPVYMGSESRVNGWCGKAVGLALKNGGVDGLPGDKTQGGYNGWEYYDKLKALGWTEISQSEPNKPGDVMVMDKGGSHELGHVAFYTGVGNRGKHSGWWSDFQQADRTGVKEGTANSYHILRYGVNYNGEKSNTFGKFYKQIPKFDFYKHGWERYKKENGDISYSNYVDKLFSPTSENDTVGKAKHSAAVNKTSYLGEKNYSVSNAMYYEPSESEIADGSNGENNGMFSDIFKRGAQVVSNFVNTVRREAVTTEKYPGENLGTIIANGGLLRERSSDGTLTPEQMSRSTTGVPFYQAIDRFEKASSDQKRLIKTLFDENGEIRKNESSKYDETIIEKLNNLVIEVKEGNEIGKTQVQLAGSAIDATVSTARSTSAATANAIAGLTQNKPPRYNSEESTI